jgi:hypothetical protein
MPQDGYGGTTVKAIEPSERRQIVDESTRLRKPTHLRKAKAKALKRQRQDWKKQKAKPNRSKNSLHSTK